MTIDWFMISIMNPLLLITGVLLGATWALYGGQRVYRTLRRRRLRRDFRSKKPRRISPALEPRWCVYDPAEPHVDSRCICHNRRIREGEPVLLWPEAGDIGLINISVYCPSVKELVS